MRQRDRRDGHLEGDPVGLDVAQHLVEVEAAVQPHPARRPSAAASMLSRPRMCDGGVATWKRSSGAETERVAPVRAWRAPIERCVCRTAFGMPVVPELNTSTASSSAPRRCRSAAPEGGRNGHHIWVPLPPSWNRTEFASYVQRQGLGVVTAEAFSVEDAPPHAIRVSLGAASSRAELVRGLEILAGALRSPAAVTRVV